MIGRYLVSGEEKLLVVTTCCLCIHVAVCPLDEAGVLPREPLLGTAGPFARAVSGSPDSRFGLSRFWDNPSAAQTIFSAPLPDVYAYLLSGTE